MARPRKYLKGARIRSLSQLSAEIGANRYVIMNDKPQHPGWVASMQFNFLRFSVARGMFSRSRLNPKWKERA